MANAKRSRPTMLDVANLAGVSYQTVSRVINNHPYVSDDARVKVQNAIDVLGYRPSKAATTLRSKVSKTIGIILYGSWFYGPVQVALNVEMAAKTSGLDVILTNVTETEEQVTQALQHMKDWSVDGIIMIIPAHGLRPEQIKAICEDVPVVHVDARPAPSLPSVSLDDRYGVQQVVQHLLALGHTHFCEISGPLNWHSGRLRHETCKEILKTQRVRSYIHIEGNWTTPGGYQAARRLLEQGHPFSAVIAASDSTALGVYRALHNAGLRVPEDVSVIGYDDILEAAYFTPPLTTVSHDYIVLGTLGFEYLLQLMDDPETEIEQKLVMPRLIVRESTATARL